MGIKVIPIPELSEEMEAEIRKLISENERLRAVADAARKLAAFMPGPILISPEEMAAIRDLRAALTALNEGGGGGERRYGRRVEDDAGAGGRRIAIHG